MTTATVAPAPERIIPFTMVYNAVLERADLNPFELALYVALARHVNRESGLAWPSYSRLQQTAHMCRESVSKYLKSLEAKGLIRIIRRYQPGKRARAVNHYRLLVPAELSSGSLRPAPAEDGGSLPVEPEVVCAAADPGLPVGPEVVCVADGNEIEENQREDNIQMNQTGAAAPPVAPDGAPPLEKPDQKKLKDSWGNFCHTLANVCRLDYAANKAKIRRVAALLWRDGRGYSSADLRTFERWWYRSDWRGKKGDVPRLDEVVQTIRIAVEERPRTALADAAGDMPDRYRYIMGKYADVVHY